MVAAAWPIVGDGTLVVVVVVFVGMAAILLAASRRRAERRDVERLLARVPELHRTVIPTGLTPDQLAYWSWALPTGDRRVGTEHAVEGPMRCPVLGTEHDVTVAAFRWWWEDLQRRRAHRASRSHRLGNHYRRRHLVAGVAALPGIVERRVMIRPESALGRAGLTRGGHLFESDEFNRNFRVESTDHADAIAFLDADMQRLIVEDFTGRTIEIFSGLLVLTGEPAHRDESLTGVVGMLPAVRQDVHRLLRAVPAAYWRRTGMTRAISVSDDPAADEPSNDPPSNDVWSPWK